MFADQDGTEEVTGVMAAKNFTAILLASGKVWSSVSVVE